MTQISEVIHNKIILTLIGFGTIRGSNIKNKRNQRRRF
jgi:hypothetical protein